ncbi:DoxX family protein [Jongsikchunia kroppenstedtii]|uniref:DoxX family protein n=1 Tax=Jongsikchunia kroppenstedtii TaxID=1121721 RepID=UPI000367FBCB|nr:DoxX family protein [Jongsikchunia kroppenstedtii]
MSALAALVVRVALGIFWLHEGYVKYHAGFGRADILLVVNSTQSNSRVPHFYQLFTEHVLGNAPAFFGVLVPLIEVGLGVALILGVFTVPVALASVAQLCNYWFADQLITQYPIMLFLSAVVIALAPWASRYSVMSINRVSLRWRSIADRMRPRPGRM